MNSSHAVLSKHFRPTLIEGQDGIASRSQHGMDVGSCCSSALEVAIRSGGVIAPTWMSCDA